MSTYQFKKVKIAEIEAKLDNPRFNLADNQRDAFDKMIADQQSLNGTNKLLNLAKDIVKNGLNPADRIIVAIHVADPKKFMTLEGNRRIICLKLLDTPEIIEQSHPKLYKQFKVLSREFSKAPVQEIDCVVFQDEEDAKKWIELKHTGENNGVGIVGWDAQQSGRFAGSTNLALQAIDFLRNSAEVDEEFKTNLVNVPSSSLNRLLDDPDFRKKIGFQKVGNKLSTNIESSEARKILVKIVKDLLNPNFKVKKIYTKENRKDYLQAIPESDLPDCSKNVDLWNLEAPPEPQVQPEATTTINTNTTTRKPRPNPLSTDRKTLIPSTFNIKISETKPNSIYHELRKLNVNDFPNCAGVMFRVFLELSADAYSKKHLSTRKNSDSFSDKIKKVATHFESNGIMANDELLGIRQLGSSSDEIFSVTTLNKYVHNYNFQPITLDLKTQWNNIQLFLQKIWENY